MFTDKIPFLRDIAYKNQYKGVEVHIQKVLKAGVPVLLFYGFHSHLFLVVS